MYRNLDPKSLGITGRQSEIIELALTYGFRGVDLDIRDFIKRVEHRDAEYAARFVKSAKIQIGGFDLPVRWRGDEALYKADLAQLNQHAACVSHAEAKICQTLVLPGSDSLPYHENFEQHRQRLAEMADTLAGHGIRLCIGFLAAPSHAKDQEFSFIQDAEALVTLLKSINSENMGLMLDSWNWHFGGGTLDQLRELGAETIGSLRIADGPADTERDNISDEQRLLPSNAGPVDNVAVLSLLEEQGYTGSVTAAPHPKCFSGMTRDAIVQKCSNAIESLWKAVGLNRSKAAAAADEA